MDEPDWAKILAVMYDQGVAHVPEEVPELESLFNFPDGHLDTSIGSNPSEHTLIEQVAGQTDLDEVRVAATINRMITYGLVERETNEDTTNLRVVGLTEKGFKVAHERELTSQENRRDRLLIILTATLAYSAVIQAQAAYLQIEGNQRYIFAGLLIVIGGLLLGLLWVYEVI